MNLTRAASLLLLLAAPLAALAQQGFGKLDPAPPTGLTPDQIITKFGERESAFAQARDNYTFTQSVKYDAVDDTGKVIGEYQQVTDIAFNPDGTRVERVTFAPPSTLDNAQIIMSPADFEEIEHRLPFVLTTADLPHYNVTYVGRQKIDEIDTYVFDAAPKRIEKNHRYFQGRVWVDQQDFEIVLVNGKSVPQDTRPGHEDLEPPFTTYYAQIDGQNWFPIYTKAEGILHFAATHGSLGQDVHVRQSVRYTDYKRFRATSRMIFDSRNATGGKEAAPPAPQK